MGDAFAHPGAVRYCTFLWVDLTSEAETAPFEALGGAFDIRRVREAAEIPGAIRLHAPHFLCFEFDDPDTCGIDALARTRREHPGLPVLMITGRLSEAVAMWALRTRVWDLLVKPVSIGELSQHIDALIEVTRRRGPRPAREILFPPHCSEAPCTAHGRDRRARTSRAIAHVAMHFDCKIALEEVAALCRLSPYHFCRIFRQEHGVSFGQFLLRYRIERACERLTRPGAFAKEVAYSVGFSDLSYFTRIFKRQVGVCPSEYRAGARSS